ncbi:hypothetical protein BJY52DRAFT_1225340 [Lactarius psammicola]|nr:hypothetical protein BJY52DRAFT_1225340 [Lactarius psammicola]
MCGGGVVDTPYSKRGRYRLGPNPSLYGLATTQLLVSSHGRPNTAGRKPNTNQLTKVWLAAFALRTSVERVKVVWRYAEQRLYSAVFETFSRIDHSCCPNAMFRWDKDTFSGEIRAMRSIGSDEDRPIVSMSVTDIGAYYREMEYDWITRRGK